MGVWQTPLLPPTIPTLATTTTASTAPALPGCRRARSGTLPEGGLQEECREWSGPRLRTDRPRAWGVRLRSLQLSVSQWSLHLSVSQGPFASVGQSVVFASVGRSVGRSLGVF